MKPVIDPVAADLIENELTPERLLRRTNNGGNEIYVMRAQECPNLMREIGRLRELSFRDGGGGTGADVDIDELDLDPEGYEQLFVWDPKAKEIVGGYRYIISRSTHPKCLSTEHYFRFTERFRNEYLPYTIELGRSFVQPHYQGSRANPKGLFSLDNLWDGLGALTVVMPEVKYFFGKMTMYPSYNRFGRDMILYFLNKHFEDKDNLITPFKPLQLETDTAVLEKIFCKESFKEDYKILNTEVRKLGYNIPPLVNAYMGLSPTMRMFGTAINYGFGDVEETGILIAVDEILEEKRIRHIESFVKQHPEALKITSGANRVIYEEKKEAVVK